MAITTVTLKKDNTIGSIAFDIKKYYPYFAFSKLEFYHYYAFELTFIIVVIVSQFE